ncbi:hypothetical protein UT300012_21390 [Paraclostridium bifermentans]
MNDRCDCCRTNLRGQRKYVSPVDGYEDLCAKCLDDILAKINSEEEQNKNEEKDL